MTQSEFSAWLSRRHPRRPLIMGVLNVTPDSFSDGGRFDSPDAAIAHAETLAAAGADLIDIGGESTRPGSSPIPADEQIRRVVPVIRAITGRIKNSLISIDTTQSDVARAAVDAGARLINDISAGREDSTILTLAARERLPIILMHMQGTPKTMQLNPTYRDVVQEVSDFLLERRDAAIAAGVERDQILLDPGIGFGKTDEHNLQLLRATRSLATLCSPLVIGASRKGFIGRVTGESSPAERVYGTAAIVGWCAANGAGMLRVHDVGPMCKVIRMVGAIQGDL